VQAQPPEPARVAGAVAIGSPAGQVTAQSGRPRASAFDRGRVDDPGVVAPALGVSGQQADDGLELALGLAQPLVVARLVGDIGEPGSQVHPGVTQEPGLRGEAQKSLEHGQRDQFGIGEFGHQSDLGTPWAQLGTDPKFVVDLHVQCGDKGVQFGVHLASMVGLGLRNTDHGRLCRVHRGPSFSGDPLESTV
jgi:hypothetical protein